MPTGKEQRQFPKALWVNKLCSGPTDDSVPQRRRPHHRPRTNGAIDIGFEIWEEACIICQLAMTKSKFPKALLWLNKLCSRPTNPSVCRPTLSPTDSITDQPQMGESIWDVRYGKLLASYTNWERPKAIAQGVVVEVQRALSACGRRQTTPPTDQPQTTTKKVSYADWQ